jgi:hypothetical protein
MAPKLQNVNDYSTPQGLSIPNPKTVIAKRAPTSLDMGYNIGTIWINKAASNSYQMVSTNVGAAVWILLGGLSGYPITPFVVGPVGQAGYQTIQSALNAANAAGGGIVYVMPGTYTENLTLYGNTEVVGTPGNSDSGTAGNCTIIVGVHTPPTTGSFTFANVQLQSATHVFSSTAAGSANLVVINISIVITSGFFFNLPNWTGVLITYNVGDTSTNNGMVNNTGGAICFFISATHGAGTGQTMVTSGTVIMQEVDLNCPWNAETGTSIACDYVIFSQSVTASNNSTGSFKNCTFNTGSNAAFTMSSSGAINMVQSIINTSHNPSIAGSGAGVLSLFNMTWLNNAVLAGTLTLSGTTFTPTTNTSLSTGTLSIKSTSANPGNNAGFIEILVGGTTAWVPYFTNIAP